MKFISLTLFLLSLFLSQGCSHFNSLYSGFTVSILLSIVNQLAGRDEYDTVASKKQSNFHPHQRHHTRRHDRNKDFVNGEGDLLFNFTALKEQALKKWDNDETKKETLLIMLEVLDEMYIRKNMRHVGESVSFDI